MIIIRNRTITASPSGSTLTPLIGGVSGQPTTPPAVALVAGFTKVFTVDAFGVYFYGIDSSGNLIYWSKLTPGTAPAIIVTAGTLGAMVINLQISPDGMKLFAGTSGHKVISILTSSPHTIATVAGSGSSASTDGTGAGASFASIVTMAIDPFAGAFLIVWEGDTGNLRKVIVGSGVVTTTNYGVNGASPYISLALDKSGYYFATLSAENVAWGLIGAAGIGGNIVFSGSFTGPVCISTRVPVADNLYTFCSGVGSGASLVRLTLGPAGAPATGTVQLNGVSIVPNPVNLAGENNGQMHFRYMGIYFVDNTGVLYNVYG